MLGQGDFIQQLMDLLVGELSKDANSQYLHNLNGILETAIRATNAQYEDKDILSRLDVRLLEISPGELEGSIINLKNIFVCAFKHPIKSNQVIHRESQFR